MGCRSFTQELLSNVYRWRFEEPPARRTRERSYSRSNPWLLNLSVRLFSVTVRTT